MQHEPASSPPGSTIPSNTMPPPEHKNLPKESEADARRAIESSVTAIDEGEQMPQEYHVETSRKHPQEFASSMVPPPTPTQDGVPPSSLRPDGDHTSARTGLPETPQSSAKPPHSAQMTISQKQAKVQPQNLSKARKILPVETEAKAAQTAQTGGLSENAMHSQSRKRSSDAANSEDQEEDDVDSVDDPMEDFDWTDLQERYRAKINAIAHREQGVMEEFNELCNVRTT
jgi:hypothetical protein